MARRARAHEEELPFVALMDTMTNVVGVLIIVLVMVGIGLARTVNKVLSELPPVTKEEFAKIKQDYDATKPKEDPKKVEEDTVKLAEELKKKELEKKELDRDKDKRPKLVDTDDLMKQLEARQKERDTKKATIDKLLADVDAMKARLDQTPVYVPPPAMIVKLPNPRPMPEKAEIHRFLVAGGKVLYINELQLQELVENELKRAESTMAVSKESPKGPDGKPVMVRDRSGRMQPLRKVVYDPKKVNDLFARIKLQNRDLRVEVVTTPNNGRIPMKLIPQPNSGETIDQARKIVSQFQTVLKKMKIDPQAVCWFYVFKDSIGTYLDARDIVDQIGVPAGWELTGNAFFNRQLPPEFAVTFTAPPPNTNPQPIIQIAPPKQTLD